MYLLIIPLWGYSANYEAMTLTLNETREDFTNKIMTFILFPNGYIGLIYFLQFKYIADISFQYP